MDVAQIVQAAPICEKQIIGRDILTIKKSKFFQ